MNTAKVTAKQIGEALRALREHKGLTVRDVVKRSAMGASTLLRLEAGDPRVTLGAAGAVAKALGTTLPEALRAARTAPKGKPGLTVAQLAAAVIALPERIGDKAEAVELAAVREALRSSGGNQSAAARLLGMERKAFVRRLARADRLAA